LAGPLAASPQRDRGAGTSVVVLGDTDRCLPLHSCHSDSDPCADRLPAIASELS
jgi:hypothetical protein